MGAQHGQNPPPYNSHYNAGGYGQPPAYSPAGHPPAYNPAGYGQPQLIIQQDMGNHQHIILKEAIILRVDISLVIIHKGEEAESQ
ncbi:hypothetical protein NQ314_019365 [Rhamnusium bicolor]|uniref:Rhodopsin n=1 Tax=Rhamnusium bicolor TaxID=1586634 RepID=A0AAV8WPQ9_9CUCU|nr:hypothetical protein NQ314_019365 [Rhamnusium bicolor]